MLRVIDKAVDKCGDASGNAEIQTNSKAVGKTTSEQFQESI